MNTPTRAAVTGGDGVRLAVTEAGPSGGPTIVLLHGWAQSAQVWAGVLGDPGLTGSFRLIAADLRGHGASDAPEQGYDDSGAWAADVAALIEYAGAPVVLVGWSYGGLVIADYLRVFGTAGVAGVVLVGAITEIGRGRAGGAVGPVMGGALPAALSEDPVVAVPALVEFSAGTTAKPVAGELAQRLLGTSLATPPRVRGALFRRTVDSADVLAGLDVPVHVLHGRLDKVVDPAAAEFALATIPQATVRWFDEDGHLPFAESPHEFSAELAGFARKVLL